MLRPHDADNRQHGRRSMRIALLTFTLLAGLGLAAGSVAPRLEPALAGLLATAG